MPRKLGRELPRVDDDARAADKTTAAEASLDLDAIDLRVFSKSSPSTDRRKTYPAAMTSLSERAEMKKNGKLLVDAPTVLCYLRHWGLRTFSTPIPCNLLKHNENAESPSAAIGVRESAVQPLAPKPALHLHVRVRVPVKKKTPHPPREDVAMNFCAPA